MMTFASLPTWQGHVLCLLLEKTMYQLEIISSEPKQRKYPHPLLLVHGAYVAAWCWEEHFIPWFTEQGYAVHALSLRGHGESEGNLSLHSFRLRDFADDIALVAEGLDAPPILVGHSMGGMVIQKYLEHATVPGALFLTTIPISGVGVAGFEIAIRSPLMYAQLCMVQNWGNNFATPEFARSMLFSKNLSHEDFLRYQPRFQAESSAAIMDVTMMDLPLPAKVNKVPMHFIGAEDDHLFSPHLIRQTAEAYNCEAEFIPHAPHMVMLDPAWKSCAQSMHSWFQTLI
jgi:non-heme chloroperoxidase